MIHTATGIDKCTIEVIDALPGAVLIRGTPSGIARAGSPLGESDIREEHNRRKCKKNKEKG